jgi:hypothetical protein
MSDIKDGGQAFPVPDGTGGLWHGMTLRDYFAAKAMQGLLAHPECKQVDDEVAAAVGVEAFCVADAMLAAREVQP